MKLPTGLTTITLPAKALILTLAIIFSLVSFFLGMQYQRVINTSMPRRSSPTVRQGQLLATPTAGTLPIPSPTSSIISYPPPWRHVVGDNSINYWQCVDKTEANSFYGNAAFPYELSINICPIKTTVSD